MRCRTLVRTSHPSGSRHWSDPGKGMISRPWQVHLPQKTVGTTPPPTVADSQILWLPLGSNPFVAHGVGVPADHNPCELYLRDGTTANQKPVVLSQTPIRAHCPIPTV
jgi:hypothetical protein